MQCEHLGPVVVWVVNICCDEGKQLRLAVLKVFSKRC